MTTTLDCTPVEYPAAPPAVAQALLWGHRPQWNPDGRRKRWTCRDCGRHAYSNDDPRGWYGGATRIGCPRRRNA
jgi:hypothetical protein